MTSINRLRNYRLRQTVQTGHSKQEHNEWDTLLELRKSYDDSSSVCILYMPVQQVFQPKNASRGLTRKPPQSAWIDKKNAEFCGGVHEVVQPFSRGPAKSAALRLQSFMAAMFHLQKSNCGLSAQVILPLVAPSHAFNLWLICGPRPPLSSSAQPGFSWRNSARARLNGSRGTRTPCSLDLWPQCLVSSCVWLSIFFFTSHHSFPITPTSLFSLLCPSKNSSTSVKSISSLR